MGLSKGYGEDVGVNSPMGSLVLDRKVTRSRYCFKSIAPAALRLDNDGTTVKSRQEIQKSLQKSRQERQGIASGCFLP